MKIANAFSISMLGNVKFANVQFAECSVAAVSQALRSFGGESYVGHADTAAILSGLLNIEVPVNRASLVLEMGETLFVAQYSGPRLPEGAKELPEGASFKFYSVRIV